MKINLLMILTFLLPDLTANIVSAQDYTPEDGWRDAQIAFRSDKSPVAQQRMEWWHEARLGMFIHWNPSSLAAGEISWSKQFYEDDGDSLMPNPRPDPGFPGMHEHNEWLSWFKPAVPEEVYDNLCESFYPAMFDAGEIVAQAEEAGIKYIVMVAKHHDGFCMWDSRYTDFDIMATPFKRDILGEMAGAAHKAGLKFGIYYSQRDWHHPDYRPGSMAQYNEYMRNQLTELLSNYGEISVLFFDAGEWKTWELWEGDRLFRLAYSLQPGIIINDRCGVPGDYSTPEQKIGTFNKRRDWESCMTLTGFWSWHGFQSEVIPWASCLKYLISCAGGDGNLLINVGPMPIGQIDPREASCLRYVGGWLQKYGESIYGTRGGPFLPGENFVSTYRGNQIFIHMLNMPDSTLFLPAIKEKVTGAEVLAGPKLTFLQSGKGISVQMPAGIRPDPVVVIRLTTDKDISEE